MFHALSLEDKAVFDNYKSFGVSHSQYNFTNLFMWRREYNPEIAVINGFLCIVICYYGHRMALFPVGQGDVKTAIESIFKIYGNITLTALDDKKISMLKNMYPELICYNVRKNYDYVYKTEKLISLSGKKLHSKRNHLKRFFAGSVYEYRCLSEDLLSECEWIEKEWIKSKKISKRSARYEYLSTMSILDNFKYLGCKGGIIFVNNKPAAYAIGEMMTDNMALIHIEKAVGGHEGIYTAINQLCIENEFADSVFVNREEDMGLESLRKAKLSYYPETMLQYKRARIIL